ncbi:hypothetical protein P3S67_015229 [Capsicum chacoense]
MLLHHVVHNLCGSSNSLKTLVSPLLYYDNTSVINMAKNSVQHKRTKHIDVRHHFLRDSVEKGLIKIVSIALMIRLLISSPNYLVENLLRRICQGESWIPSIPAEDATILYVAATPCIPQGTTILVIPKGTKTTA